MLAPIRPPLAAAPLLFLALQKVARTQTARLAVGYRLVPRWPAIVDVYIPADTWLIEHPQLVAAGVARRLADKSLHRIGEALYLDRLLAGGIVGEELPLSVLLPDVIVPLANLRLDAERHAPPGAILDVVV